MNKLANKHSEQINVFSSVWLQVHFWFFLSKRFG